MAARAIVPLGGRTFSQHVAGWLNDVHIATAGNATIEERKAKVATLTGAMMAECPEPAMYCPASMLAMAKQNRFFPSFAELSAQLTEWWERTRPKTFTVPVELDGADLSGRDRSNVEVWLKHAAADDIPMRELVLRLSVIRRVAEAGFRWLINHDNRAAEIAVKHGWTSEIRQPATDAEREEVSATVRKLYAGNQAVDVYDPPSAVAPAALASRIDPEVEAAFVKEHGRKPGALTPEQLHKTRMETPGLRAVAEREATMQEQRKLAEEAAKAPEKPKPTYRAAWHDAC
jgi:hypothetical protein